MRNQQSVEDIEPWRIFLGAIVEPDGSGGYWVRTVDNVDAAINARVGQNDDHFSNLADLRTWITNQVTMALFYSLNVLEDYINLDPAELDQSCE